MKKKTISLPLLLTVLLLSIISCLIFNKSARTTTAPKKDKRVVNLSDEVTNTYINKEFNFQVKYPKYERSYMNEGETIPYAVFEEPSKKKIYISFEKLTISRVQKNKYGDYYETDPTSVKIVNNSLSLIKNGYENGYPKKNGSQMNITKPRSVEIFYKKINSDKDLLDLAHEYYSNACDTFSKSLVDEKAGIYRIDISGKERTGNPSQVNFICYSSYHIFLYSEPNGVAVMTSSTQDAMFNGTNNQSEPKIIFN